MQIQDDARLLKPPCLPTEAEALGLVFLIKQILKSADVQFLRRRRGYAVGLQSLYALRRELLLAAEDAKPSPLQTPPLARNSYLCCDAFGQRG
ncbi:hypothetical protein EYF80_030987 [Liparis tanakae]|uniref:Uncharacterized protein n=1 Tax=Liparis tanakae TaxID=230148 RepID=A0A4Z2GYZ9_9TELE|nr:hypothetical protein EYF80_030987 [Liparis tanakae]